MAENLIAYKPMKEGLTVGFKIKEEQVLYDAKGRKTHILIPYKTYEEIVRRLEDAEDLKAMREVEDEPSVPWGEAKKKLRKKRK